MVIEFLDVAAVACDGAFLGGELPTKGLLPAAAGGAVVGLVAHDLNQAIVGGALAGALMPLLHKNTRNFGSIAMSVVTSTALGAVVNTVKTNWQAKQHNTAPAKTQAAEISR